MTRSRDFETPYDWPEGFLDGVLTGQVPVIDGEYNDEGGSS